MDRKQIAKLIAEALASMETDSKKTSPSAKKGKVVCEKVAAANKKAEKAGFPTLLTTSDVVAKRENFKTTKDGSYFECRDCGCKCRTYGVLMNHYRNQTGNTKVKASKKLNR